MLIYAEPSVWSVSLLSTFFEVWIYFFELGRNKVKTISNRELEFGFSFMLQSKNNLVQFYEFLLDVDFSLCWKFMSVSGSAGRVDLPGFKVLNALLPGRMFMLDLPVAQVMPWGWTWFPKESRMFLISFKMISLTWMLLASLVIFISLLALLGRTPKIFIFLLICFDANGFCLMQINNFWMCHKGSSFSLSLQLCTFLLHESGPLIFLAISSELYDT